MRQRHLHSHGTPTAREYEDMREQAAAVDTLLATIKLSIDGTIVRANEAFMRMTGYAHEELAGTHHRILVPGTFSASPAYAQLWERLASGVRVDGRFECVAKGGRRLWVQASYNPMGGSAGEPRKVLAYVSDVTTSKLNADLKAALDAVAAHVMVTDLDDNIVYTNESLARMFSDCEPLIRRLWPGFRAEGLVGNNVDMLDARLTSPFGTRASRLAVGGCEFDVVSHPIRGESGDALGTVIEWKAAPPRENR